MSKIKTRLEKHQQKEFVDTMMYGLSAPLIVTPDWTEGVPAEQSEKHRLYCIAEAINCVDKKEATDYDAMLYYSYASLSVMPSHEDGECYQFLFFKYFDDAENMLGMKCPKLDDKQLLSIKKLKQWIYKKQIDGMKK